GDIPPRSGVRRRGADLRRVRQVVVGEGWPCSRGARARRFRGGRWRVLRGIGLGHDGILGWGRRSRDGRVVELGGIRGWRGQPAAVLLHERDSHRLLRPYHRRAVIRARDGVSIARASALQVSDRGAGETPAGIRAALWSWLTS